MNDGKIERLEAELADLRRTHIKLDVDVEDVKNALGYITATVSNLTYAEATEFVVDLLRQVLAALDGETT